MGHGSALKSVKELPSLPNTGLLVHSFLHSPSLSQLPRAARRSVFQASQLQIAASIMRDLLWPIVDFDRPTCRESRGCFAGSLASKLAESWIKAGRKTSDKPINAGVHFGLAHFVDPSTVTKLPEIQSAWYRTVMWTLGFCNLKSDLIPRIPTFVVLFWTLGFCQLKEIAECTARLHVNWSAKRWMLDPMLRAVDSNACTTRSVIQFCCCNGRVTRVTTWKAPGRLHGRRVELTPCQPALLISHHGMHSASHLKIVTRKEGADS
jgi:hypothetical protein